MRRQPACEQMPETILPDARPETDAALNPLLQRPLRQTPDLPVNGVLLGRVVEVTEHALRVRIPALETLNAPESADGPELTARALCPLPDDWAERECAMLFENGDPARPLVVGFLLPDLQPAHPIEDRKLSVDGEKVVIRADSELELRCGESVILLQRDGRIEIRGNYITSQATATQRLRGGSIHMN